MKISRGSVLGMIVLLVGVQGLQGSETRIVGMGYLANYYVRDSYNIWNFPSTIVNYQSMVFAESYINNGLWRGGIHVPVSSTFTLGVYLENTKSRLEHSDTEFLGRDSVYTGLGEGEAAHQFTLFGGLQMEEIDVALFVSSYSSKLKYTRPDTSIYNFEDKLGEYTVGMGISVKLDERSRFDGTVFYSWGDFSHVVSGRDTVQHKQPEGYNGYGVGARLFYALSSKTVVVPFASYVHGGEGYRWLVRDALKTGGDENQTKIDKYDQYILGIGVDFIPRERTLVTIAGGLVYYSATEEVTWFSGTPPVADKYSYTALPFVSIGLEAKLTRWLSGRFSFYELLETWVGEGAVTETLLDKYRLTGSTYAANFGLSFHLGRFDIDTIIDTDGLADFLHHGPYIISGKDYSEGYEGLFTQLSVTYNFK